MTESPHAPLHASPPVPVADEPIAPAVPLADRRAAGLAVVSAYRAKYPGDLRSDEELLRAPYGGYELADLAEDLAWSRDERLRRLARTARKEEKK